MKEQALNQLYARVTGCCCDCPGEREGAGLVRDRSNPDVGIVLLGEAPGGEEIKKGVPFAGQAGRKLVDYLALAGLTRADVFIINSVKCRPTKNNDRANRKPNACEIKACAHWLDEELAILSPVTVVTLGDVALKKFGGNAVRIGNYHGQPLVWGELTVFPMYHPAAAIYRRALEDVIAEDFAKLGRWLQRKKLKGA
ncbi:uracil-DNA glycosylase [Desulfoscipio geothermicus]|uniref:DNA polymerase n=1 Tax=Desulfoscipio geothermicus DSM 3669 TaxID=1121426 RepID=A0A1I6CS10_9FIRM|nr:uracil-DNA glycosylase [Desulfoscipio geothermicus]SFQ95922.1 DNA polymerase [Desulfoscipio geothermicus DSM 3669]